MSHYSILVITPDEPNDEHLEELLAPWHDEGPEDSHWDYFRLGGRWLRSLLILPGRPSLSGEIGYEFDPKYNEGRDPFEGVWPDGVDAARFEDLDWSEMRRRRDPEPPLTCWGACDGKVWIDRFRRTSIHPTPVEDDSADHRPYYDDYFTEKSSETWQAELEGLLKRQPSGIWLAVVDCHD